MYARPSTQLVATWDGRIVGLSDTEYEEEPGQLCFLKDSPGGYVLEFGRLPEYAGHEIGLKLMAATVQDAMRKGYRRHEYWTQDRKAQRYYQRLGMNEIGRHYRFRMEAPDEVKALLAPNRIGIEYLYAACMPEEWPLIKETYTILHKPPLEPHLCIGYEVRF